MRRLRLRWLAFLSLAPLLLACGDEVAEPDGPFFAPREIEPVKELDPLLTQHLNAKSHGYVVGLVALTGKVVEHEHGFRAERAEIVALAAVGVDGYLETEDIDEVADVCDAPEPAVRLGGRLRPSGVLGRIERFLNACRERRLRWT